MARVYRDLISRWGSAEALAQADETEVREVIRPLGLVKRAATLIRLADEVVTRGGVPQTVEGLRSLPGVGEYASTATATVAFGVRAPTVDSVSARVYRRCFGLTDVEHKTIDDDLRLLVDWVTPRRAHREWNWAVLDLAAAVCLPANPRCPDCPVQRHCVWGNQERLPQA